MNEDVDLAYDNLDQKKFEVQDLIKKLNVQSEINAKIREQQIEVNAKVEQIDTFVKELLVR